MYVVVAFTYRVGGHVDVSFHSLHPDVTAVVDVLLVTPAACRAVHGVMLAGTRNMLGTLHGVRLAQRAYEAGRAREMAAMGVPRSHKACIDPVALHDANTLYAGLVGGMVGGTCWFRDSKACERCGENSWSLTCTPPRLSKDGRLTRDELDRTVAFCWTCLARRGAASTPASG